MRIIQEKPLEYISLGPTLSGTEVEQKLINYIVLTFLPVCCLVLLSTAEIIKVRSAVNSFISLKKKFGLQSEIHQEK